MVRQKIAEYAKLVAALVGAGVASFTLLIPADWAPWLTAASTFLTAAAVLLVPNAPTQAQRDRVLAIQAGLTESEREADMQAALSRYEPKHRA